MNRDIRLYLLAIALPVILFAVLGGVALVQEASRLRRSDHDSLRIQAEVFASRFRVRARQRAHDLLGGIADDPVASRAGWIPAISAARSAESRPQRSSPRRLP